MSERKKRVAQLVFKNLSDIILRELKSPLCLLASVNEVRLNPDNSVATAYVTHLEPDKREALLRFLIKNKGKIRSMLAGRLDVYKVPDIVFKLDDLYDRGERIDKLLDTAFNRTPKTLNDLEDKKD